MQHAHIKAILEGVIPEVKEAISTAQKPLLERVEKLESREILKGEPGRDGVDGKDGIDGKDGDPGQSVTVDDLRSIIADAVAEIPKPADGKSVTVDDVAPIILDHFQANFSALAKSVEEIEPRLSAPPELAEKIASGVRMLAEAPPLQIAAVVSPPIVSLDLKGVSTKRKLVFERDDNNRIIAAHEEAET